MASSRVCNNNGTFERPRLVHVSAGQSIVWGQFTCRYFLNSLHTGVSTPKYPALFILFLPTSSFAAIVVPAANKFYLWSPDQCLNGPQYTGVYWKLCAFQLEDMLLLVATTCCTNNTWTNFLMRTISNVCSDDTGPAPVSVFLHRDFSFGPLVLTIPAVWVAD